MEKRKLTNWALTDNKNINVAAAVPGDITMDLYRGGLIEDPYYGMNHNNIGWIAEKDFDYTTKIIADDAVMNEGSVELVFDGIDLFSEIYLNGTLLGKTENMFRQYRFEIKPLLNKGVNELKVAMKSTMQVLKTIDASSYVGVFNKERLLIRKAQCHFGWDWAPNICAYGIWGDVYLETSSEYKIIDVNYIADDKGNLTFFTEINYNLRPIYAPGAVIAVAATEYKDDKLVFSVSDKPFSDSFISKTVEIEARINFINFKFDNPELWWPSGYGAQPLYNYRIELIRDGKVCSRKEGRLAFRTVELSEPPHGENVLGHAFFINGREIFVKGSNWVPVECFTGEIKDEKYRRLVKMAADANFNMLRIWGGGIYEKEVFYDACDELGIMVWQDIALACGDIPDDKPEWVSNMLSEVEYQVKRLRLHPSLVYWCGGNEKTGSFALEITKGDFFVDYTLPGFVNFYDSSRPYRRQSPYSHTEVGNDITSGESHYSCFERCLEEGIVNYRNLISECDVPFVSEAALLGPNSVETFKKIIPADKLWPMNEVWNDRLMDNPYAVIKMDFAHRELKYAADMYGEGKNLCDFVAKGMQVHAEAMRAEIEFCRANKGFSSGFMNWMYSDIWPQGTWAVIDYFCEPKQVYYQMKRSFAPLLVTFVQKRNKNTELVVINDLFTPFSSEITFGAKTFDGKIVFEDKLSVVSLTNGTALKKVEFDCESESIYLFAEYYEGGKKRVALYSPKFWRNVPLKPKDYSVFCEQITDREVVVKVKANSFAKSVFISLPNNCDYSFSDNYVDIEAGQEATVVITAEKAFDKESVTVTDFAEQTKMQ